MVGFLGIGMMMQAFRHVGTVACVRNRLNSLVRIPVSWSAHTLTTAPRMLSSPAAFLGFTAFRLNSPSVPGERGEGCLTLGEAVCAGVWWSRSGQRSCLAPLPGRNCSCSRMRDSKLCGWLWPGCSSTSAVGCCPSDSPPSSSNTPPLHVGCLFSGCLRQCCTESCPSS